jgi:TRAP transporter TAXI family solute receptor
VTPPPDAVRLLGRRTVLGLLGAGALAVTAACSEPARQTVRLGTAERGGFFHEFGELLAGVVREDDRLPFVLSTEATRGALENLAGLSAGRLDLALSLADAATAAETGPLAVGKVYENYVQIAVPQSSSIRRVGELSGRRVSFGATGSGTRFAAGRMLEVAGVAPGSVVDTPLPVLELLDAMADDRIDAAIFVGGVPHPPVDPAGGRGPAGGIRLLDLGETAAGLRDRFGPVYQPVVLPPGIYGSSSPVTTIGISSLLLVRPDLSHVVVADVVDMLLTRSDALVPAGALGAQYLDTRSLVHTFGIPLHPGAASAYRAGHG